MLKNIEIKQLYKLNNNINKCINKYIIDFYYALKLLFLYNKNFLIQGNILINNYEI